MPQKAGPWSLDKVKTRLRQEQVEREEEASARYRQHEARRAKEETVGGTGLSRCRTNKVVYRGIFQSNNSRNACSLQQQQQNDVHGMV